MKRLRNLFLVAGLAIAGVGVIGPNVPAANAQCDPEPVSVGDDSTSSRCSNSCQKLGAAVAKVTGQSLWECTQ